MINKRIKRDSKGRRTDRVKKSEEDEMRSLYAQHWTIAEIAKKLNRKEQTVKLHLSEKEEQPLQTPITIESAIAALAQERANLSLNEHERALRDFIKYLITSLSDLRSPVMPNSPQTIIFPYPGGPIIGNQPIERDPSYQSLWEHLKDTEIPKLWDELKVTKFDNLLARTPDSQVTTISTDPVFIEKERQKMDKLRSKKGEIWLRYIELTDITTEKLRQLLLLNKLPGRCDLCSPEIENKLR